MLKMPSQHIGGLRFTKGHSKSGGIRVFDAVLNSLGLGYDMAGHLQNTLESFLKNLPRQESLVASHVKADWLLVNCIDCRYPHAIHEFMHHHYADQVYDHLVLAGAALAGVKRFTHVKSWAETFKDHVGLAIDLHSIDGVLILNHRTCGAFVKFGLIPDHPEIPDPSFEFDQHQMVARRAAEIVIDVFRSKNRSGVCEVHLTPAVSVGGEFSEPALPLVRLGT